MVYFITVAILLEEEIGVPLNKQSFHWSLSSFIASSDIEYTSPNMAVYLSGDV
jgi:hypothetical protein